jgi:hypothetical protein
VTESEVIDARALKLTFVNGDTRTFAFEPADASEPTAIAQSFNRFVESGYVLLEKDDRMIFIPMANVQSLEIMPKPEGVLPNATHVLYEFE